MATCFLFTHSLTDEGCLSVCLDQQGEIISPLAVRNFSEIKSLQKNNQTICILPSILFSLHRLALPLLADKKARAALPFALEDKLAQNVTSLHFAFDRNHYEDGHYLIVVGDKIYLTDLLARLKEKEISLNSVTLDWFALEKQELAILESYLLVNNQEFQGALSDDLSELYLNKIIATSSEHTLFIFKDSNPAMLTITKSIPTVTKDNAFVWLAQRLQNKKAINLCQGELEHQGTKSTTKRWYQAAIAMSIIWIISLLVTNGLKLYSLNKDTVAVDNQIATIYRKFFPQAQQVISPKFRISQLLKSNQSNVDSSFWFLLNTLSKAIKNNNAHIEQVRFQNQILLVTLNTKSFEELESLQTRLQKMNIKVRQTQASTEKEKVVGTLELSL